MAQVAELLLDFESLFNLYTREAVCLNVAGRGIQKLETQQKPEIENEEMTTLNPGNGEDEEEEGEPKIDISSLKPEVKAIVANLVTSSISSGPVEDEKVIEKVTNAIERKLAQRLKRRRQQDKGGDSANLSDEVLTEEDKSNLRPVVLEEMHKHRLELHKKEALKDWPSKKSKTESKE